MSGWDFVGIAFTIGAVALGVWLLWEGRHGHD